MHIHYYKIQADLIYSVVTTQKVPKVPIFQKYYK